VAAGGGRDASVGRRTNDHDRKRRVAYEDIDWDQATLLCRSDFSTLHCIQCMARVHGCPTKRSADHHNYVMSNMLCRITAQPSIADSLRRRFNLWGRYVASLQPRI
jgi:hypothetical protein